jgi:predicted hydrocarbon binding protein
MKCPVCENPIQKIWKHCPECGVRLDNGNLVYEEYSIDRLKSIWSDREGEKFYKNFKSLKNLGTSPFKKIKPVRSILGDYVNVHISNLKTFSILSIQPKFMGEICEIYRYLGYFSADMAFKSVKFSGVVDMIGRTEFYWNLLARTDVQKMFSDGWEKNHQAIILRSNLDKKKQEATYEIQEGQVSYLEGDKPINFIELHLLAGNLEATCNRRFIGEEVIKDGKTYFTYKVQLLREHAHYPTFEISPDEYERITDTLVNYIVENKTSGRKLKDNMHISGEQSDTFFTLKISEGHRILEKYAGVKSGKKIAEKAKITGEDEAYEYIKKLFKQEKIGLIDQIKKTENRTVITMTESAYSSGVQNIQMKLDLYSAGLIEGILNQATNQRWNTEETKCIANGDEHCEFTCKTR